MIGIIAKSLDHWKTEPLYRNGDYLVGFGMINFHPFKIQTWLVFKPPLYSDFLCTIIFPKFNRGDPNAGQVQYSKKPNVVLLLNDADFECHLNTGH